MIILLDTSTPEARLVIVSGDNWHEASWHADRQLAKGLLGWMQNKIEQQGDSWQAMTGIGVYRGPGSFTGLRIGVAVCNSLADNLGVPIVGATGDGWQQEAVDRLSAGESDGLVLPEYGRAAHITAPRK